MTLTFWSDQARLTEFLQPEFIWLIASIWISFSLFFFIFYSYKLEVRYKEIMSFRLKMLNMEIL